MPARIGLLLVAHRRRAAAVATGVAVGATALAALAAPDASRFYWTRTLWDTTPVGRLDYVSNQSLQGVLARLAWRAGPSGRCWWRSGGRGGPGGRRPRGTGGRRSR
ncbi:glycosyltransferase 87 family protein [Streptomyces sp. NPDC052015]|uniref:glycosyltransferase 87 family protein n=1 Tax=Streptomyces sp. NPDC052015 TaxID=3154755 RepID=UPI0034407583